MLSCRHRLRPARGSLAVVLRSERVMHGCDNPCASPCCSRLQRSEGLVALMGLGEYLALGFRWTVIQWCLLLGGQSVPLLGDGVSWVPCTWAGPSAGGEAEACSPEGC